MTVTGRDNIGYLKMDYKVPQKFVISFTYIDVSPHTKTKEDQFRNDMDSRSTQIIQIQFAQNSLNFVKNSRLLVSRRFPFTCLQGISSNPISLSATCGVRDNQDTLPHLLHPTSDQ